MEDNITTIGMEFENGEQETAENLPETTPTNNEVTVKQPGKFRRVMRTLTKPVRWAYGKVKKSPAGAAIGMMVGAGITLGAKAAIGHFRNRGDDGFIPADPPEIEIEDSGEEYASISTESEGE